ncbi:MAG TPA: GMC family oxidoreductase N-terminal domain-containing protein [Streptosporangiaceae bacterium]|nr:GMC family oxidoreductase N-terminal domain-containing protein [Streptosporangiaceae bacterium]
MQNYDYIVVGAGTAGCVIAARLSEDPGAAVLLLEAGAAERTRAMTVPNAWPENLGSAADWAQVTTEQADAGPAVYPRGKALGGSSAINAMAHVRGHPAVYDGWAARGAIGWGFDDLLPYFKRSERAEGRDQALRGTEGPIRVGPAASGRHPVAEAFIAALTAAGYPLTDDLSGPRPEGAAWVDLAIADGERVSSADGYLRPALGRKNLTVQAGCLVTSARVRNGRCLGVSYLRDGVATDASAGEVIVCGGAIGSPQLLLLSGLGPASHLRDLGIEPVADIPAVGASLQDHPVIMMSYACAKTLPVSGWNNGEACAALCSELARPFPDVHLFTILLPLAPAGREPPASGFTLVAAVVAPDSTGTLRLACADPRVAPLIDPGFLTDERDLDRLEFGIGVLRRAGGSAAFDGLGTSEVWPGPDASTPAAIRAYIRGGVGSYYHPVGTCRMGRGGDAVVDAMLAVHGIDGLRVADASVLPTITNAHPNATVLAIAERAADLIRGDVKGSAR